MTDLHLKNYMEEIVIEELDLILKERDDICKCDQCRQDIISYALNQLPPKYISTRKGEIYTRLENFKFQNQVDIVKALTEAINRVGNNPHHED